VDFAIVALEPESEVVLPDSDAVDRGEDVGVDLLPTAEELGSVAFAGVGLEPNSDAAEALRSADPDDEAVFPLEAEVFAAGPITGGMPNPAGETGFPAAEEVAAADDPEADAAAAPDTVDEEAVPGAGVGDAPRAGAADAAPGAELTAAEDALGRGVDFCDAAPDDVGAVAPLPAESVSTGPSGSNN
jgi:hypothetical protein